MCYYFQSVLFCQLPFGDVIRARPIFVCFNSILSSKFQHLISSSAFVQLPVFVYIGRSALFRVVIADSLLLQFSFVGVIVCFQLRIATKTRAHPITCGLLGARFVPSSSNSPASTRSPQVVLARSCSEYGLSHVISPSVKVTCLSMAQLQRHFR